MSMNEEIGILQRRKIEAEIIKPIYEIMKREFGLEAARKVVEEAIAQAAIDAGKSFASKKSMAKLILKALWLCNIYGKKMML